ncbi:MAG TPA: sulfite exporter TauE/SafE family protein [Thermomicrobiales bacterium]
MPDGHLLLPVFGFVVGLLVGLTGMGGGVLMTPLLMLGLGMPAGAAVGTDLAYSTVTKIVGAWQHRRLGTIDTRVVRDLATGSIPATIAAVATLAWLDARNAGATDQWLRKAVGVALIVAVGLMLRRFLQAHFGQTEEATPVAYRRRRVIAIGVLGGFVVGITSIGSGTLIIALLVMVAPLPSRCLVGTDVAHAALLVGTAALGHLFLGSVDLVLAALLLVGSIPGVLIGSRLVVVVPRRPLQIGLAGLLLSSAVSMLR